MMNADKIARLFSWTDVIFGGIPAIIALLFMEIVPTTVPVLSWITAVITVDKPSIYSLTAVMAGTMTSISMAVTMLAVQMWRTDWFYNVMRDSEVVRKLWLSMRQFTWSMASLTVVCILAMFIESSNTAGQYVIAAYIGWLGAAMARMFRAIQYIHLMVSIAVTAIVAMSNDEENDN